MGHTTEDILMDVYKEVEEKGLKDLFDKQCKKMNSQDKHKYKTVAEKWEYALEKIKVKK